jgi:hypothetical protein
MIKAEADLTRQRMLIKADQALHRSDFDSLIETIRAEAGKLGPTWTAALDLRGMWVEDLFFGEQINLLQTVLLECGACKIGTLLDNASIQRFLGQAGVRTHSNEITQRFFNEQSWEEFLSVQD